MFSVCLLIEQFMTLHFGAFVYIAIKLLARFNVFCSVYQFSGMLPRARIIATKATTKMLRENRLNVGNRLGCKMPPRCWEGISAKHASDLSNSNSSSSRLKPEVSQLTARRSANEGAVMLVTVRLSRSIQIPAGKNPDDRTASMPAGQRASRRGRPRPQPPSCGGNLNEISSLNKGMRTYLFDQST